MAQRIGTWYVQAVEYLHPDPTGRRLQLDIYYPPAEALPSSGKTPVLFFTYGGGFFEGDRRLAHPYDLVYANTGAYFAKRG